MLSTQASVTLTVGSHFDAMNDPRSTPSRSPMMAGPDLPSVVTMRWRKLMVAYLCGVVAYHVFALLLLESTPVDRRAGTLLLINSPVTIACGVAIFMRSGHCLTLGIAVCAVQVVIADVTIYRDIGDPEMTLLFNGIALGVWIVITALCWRLRSHQLKRSWLQFDMRTILLLLTITALVLGAHNYLYE